LRRGAFHPARQRQERARRGWTESGPARASLYSPARGSAQPGWPGPEAAALGDSGASCPNATPCPSLRGAHRGRSGHSPRRSLCVSRELEGRRAKRGGWCGADGGLV